MRPAGGAFSRLFSVSLLSVVVCLGLCGEARGQGANATGDGAKTQQAGGPKKPVRKPDQVLTNDSVALLAVKRAQAADEAAATVPTMDAKGTGEDTEKKAAEIASLEKLIQDKTKKIALLMRLFVDDERPFLNDPANHKVDEVAQDRRKYEQDELLYETAALAKLKARRNELTAAK